jgi:glycosyltransferase involved in cell wall biosynthesis
VVLDGSALVDARRNAGTGRYVARLTAALGALGDRLDLTVARPRRPPVRESWPVRWLQGQPASLRAALRGRPDLIHAPAGDPVLGWPLRRQVVTLLDTVPWTAPEYRGRRVLGAWLAVEAARLRRCGALVAISPTVATEAVAVLGADAARVHVVELGVDEVFTATPARDDAAVRVAAGVPSGTRYVLWTGSLRSHDPRKALDVLVEAAAAVAATHPAVALVLAGAPGPEAARIATAGARRGLEVLLPGFVEDAVLAALHRGAAAVAVPSLHEGFGLPALEAMACGAPLVASTGGNLPALVAGAGLVVAPGDPGELATGLAAVLDDAALAARLGAAGQQRAREFTWARTAERTLAVYAALAHRGGRRDEALRE